MIKKDLFYYFEISERLNEDLKASLRAKSLHFRGNINSFSLISLKKETPERGKSGLKTYHNGRKWIEEGKIDELIKQYVEGIKAEKSKPTREKELQAWIINNALNNSGKIYFSRGLTFLTSELALYADDGRRVVNDILALDDDNNLVVIELKSDRDKGCLTKQVIEFEKIIRSKPSFFHKMTMLLSKGRPWSGKIRKIVVWPDASTSPRKDWGEGIFEICYKEKIQGGKKLIDYDEAGAIQFFA